MKLLNTLIIGGSILFMATSCNNNEKQYDNPCDELDAVDLEMLQKLDRIREDYKKEKSFLKRFNEAQIYWIQYKDRHVRALYPEKKEDYKKNYGMQYNYCKCAEYTMLTKARNAELDRWIKPKSSEKEDCPTSVK